MEGKSVRQASPFVSPGVSDVSSPYLAKQRPHCYERAGLDSQERRSRRDWNNSGGSEEHTSELQSR